jgi:outer membrane protein OmpA-like peptidoglycan-associated protein
MASFARFSALKAMTVCAALSMTAGLAFAADDTVSADQIIHALQPKPQTRSLSALDPQVDPAAKARQESFIASVRNRRTRSLTLDEREEIAEIASSKPNIDLEIQFDYNSAAISRNSTQAVQELGKALSNPSLKGSTFVVAGHTDAVGSDGFNQDLSERRADNYHIAGSDLVTVGYGKTKLKDPQNPTSGINRRVQVVNMDTKTAQK